MSINRSLQNGNVAPVFNFTAHVGLIKPILFAIAVDFALFSAVNLFFTSRK